MELRYTVIDPTKNITLLVTTPVPRDVQPRVAAELLRRERDAEQVGFAEGLAAGNPRLQMMGGEFCGNATMSMAAWLHRDLPIGESCALTLPVSGVSEPVFCQVTHLDGCFIGTVSMPLPERMETLSLPVCGVRQSLPVVFLPGICHVIVPADMIGRDRAEDTLRAWGDLLPGEAMGLLLLDESQTAFTPLVYVKPTDSCVWERGCGSGSAAIGAWLTSVRGTDQCVSLRQPGQNPKSHRAPITAGGPSPFLGDRPAFPVRCKIFLYLLAQICYNTLLLYYHSLPCLPCEEVSRA